MAWGFLNRAFYSLLGTLIAPQSRGTVTIGSSNPLDLPVVDPKYLSSPTDQKVVVEIYKKVRRIFNTDSFKSVRLNDEEFWPGESHLQLIDWQSY